MALGNKEQNYSTYLSIFNGQIVQEWRKKAPKEEHIPAGKELKTREITMGKNSGNTVWYVGYDYVAGMLTNVKLDTEGDYGSRIILTIKDVDDTYILTIPVKSSYGQSFLFKMLNIDLSKEVSFEPWTMDEEQWRALTGKTKKGGKSGLTIRQGEGDDNKIENVYTKDEPNGLPDLVRKETREGVKWYSDDRDDFLLGKLEDEFIPAVNGANNEPSKPAGNATNAPAPGADQQEEEEDDLPF